MILPEMKKSLAIFVNRSSFVDMSAALNIVKAFKINRERKKRLGNVHIHLKILDCSLTLNDESREGTDELIHGISAAGHSFHQQSQPPQANIF